MRAIVAEEGNKAVLVTDRPDPKLRDGYVLVDVKAVALNPTDWKHIDFFKLPSGNLIGCDFAGVVNEVGQDLSKTWKKGDRLCGFAHGGNVLQQEDGAFAERIVAKGDIALRIPDYMSFEDAASLGVGVLTCGQGLYQQMGLNWPNNPITNDEFVLIYGGSSATGTLGIQYAKLSGYKVITTCSPSNFDLVKSRGADHVFDYKDPECVQKIKDLTNNNLKLIWDTISVSSSVKLCEQVLAEGGTYGNIGGTKIDRPDVRNTVSIGYTAGGEPIDKPFVKRTAEETRPDFEFMKKWIALSDALLAEQKVVPHPSNIDTGLENVLNGMDLMRGEKVSGQKLVYTI